MRNYWLFAAAVAIALTLYGFMDSHHEEHPLLNEIVLFERFVAQKGVFFGSPSEKDYRLRVFASNLREILDHQKNRISEGLTYKLGIGKFSLLSSTEFKTKYLVPKNQIPTKKSGIQNSKPNLIQHKTNESMKQDLGIDWRKKNAVTPVKDQLECASDYAFAAIGVTEAAWSIFSDQLVDLSAQQIIDCSSDLVNHGCSGGDEQEGLYYFYNKGAISSQDYPYKGVQQDCIAYKFTPVTSNSKSYGVVPIGQEYLQNQINKAPAAVSIFASPLQHYQSGIYNNLKKCPSSQSLQDYSSLVVGYGTEGDNNFWILKFSWSTEWGEDGYARLAKDSSGPGVCGIGITSAFITFKQDAITD